MPVQVSTAARAALETKLRPSSVWGLRVKELAGLLASRGLAVEPSGEHRLLVRSAVGTELIKPATLAHLVDHAFLVVENIPGLEILSSVRFFSSNGKMYQATRLDPQLRAATSVEELLPIERLYRYRHCIVMLEEHKDIMHLLRGPHPNKDIDKGDGHPAGPHTALDRVVDAFLAVTADMFPLHEAALSRGFYHADLISENVLVGPDGLCLIDLDPVLHSYAVMNLAHFFVTEVLCRPANAAMFDRARAHFLGVLEPPDLESFDFFVMLTLFRTLIRRAFHKRFFHDEWEDELLWYFDRFGQEMYLRRVGR